MRAIVVTMMLALLVVAVAGDVNGTMGTNGTNSTAVVDGGDTTESSALFVARLAVIVILVSLSGLFSGLTLGLLGLDTNQLLVRAGTQQEKLNALAWCTSHPACLFPLHRTAVLTVPASPSV